MRSLSPRGRRAVPTLLASGLTLLLAACGGPQQMSMPPATVNVATVTPQPIAEWDEFTGRIEAIESVEIRPRVGGYLTGVHFEEGGLVRKGELLFTIDDREYRAAVSSARADLARAEARRALAETELKRSEALAASAAVSAGELEARRNERQQAEADVLAARARLEQAELNLGFTRVTAPIAGRVGAARLRVGNLVGAGEPVLTTVVSLDPVYVSFRADERAYLRYQAMDRAGNRPSSRETENPVRIGLASEQGFPHTGRMVFVDNVVDPATGTVFARAELTNPDGVFTPGLFARVQLLGAGQREALRVHPQAVLTDQDRRYVYVAAEMSPPDGGSSYIGAQRREVRLGPTVDGLVVVEEGLQPGDRVVVNGMSRIFFPGAPLAPVEVPMEAPNTVVEAPGPADAKGATVSSDDEA